MRAELGLFLIGHQNLAFYSNAIARIWLSNDNSLRIDSIFRHLRCTFCGELFTN